jgi:putative riboflavin transport system permease protein
MSVTTSTTEDVSLRVHQHVHGDIHAGIQMPAGKKRRARVSLDTMERVLSISPPMVLALIVLVGWYLGTSYGHIPSLILPAPGDVLTSLFQGLSSGMLLSAALVTTQESVLGFLLALVVALPLGYGLAKSRLLAAAVHPYLAAGQAIPAIVIAPLLVIWLGYGLVPNVILCMLIVLFPMVITTILGVQTIDQALTDAARVEGASGWSLLRYIEFPLALPAVLAGIRTSLTLSVMGAVVGEFVSGGDQGLGALVQLAKEQFDTPALFATLVILAVLAGLYYGVSWLLVKLAEAVY